MKSNWEKAIDFQKSSKETYEDQYDRFYQYVSDMMDGFAETLPQEIPWAPAWAKEPKSLRKMMKEWEEMANAHIKEQAASQADFFIKSQEKACAQIPEAKAKEDEKDEEKKETAAAAKAAEEPKTTRQTRQTK